MRANARIISLRAAAGAALLASLLAIHPAAARQEPLTTAFTYQGQLTENGTPANGVFDFQFRLFASTNTIGLPLGTVLVNDATATNGLFTVALDFGVSPFSGPARWLEGLADSVLKVFGI